MAVECREQSMLAEQAADEIRAIAASVGHDAIEAIVTDAARSCIAHYFELPLHD